MENETTFFDKTKRFLEPIKTNKVVYFWWFIIYGTWALDKVIHILFLEKIIYFLENKNTEEFIFLIKTYFIYIVFYTIFIIFSRKKWWTEIPNTTEKFLQNKYLKDFVKMNNNYVERFWTWKLTAIVKTWIEKWSSLFELFIARTIEIFISFLFTSYMLYKNDLWFLLVFVIAYFSFYVIAYFLNLWALKYRRFRRDYRNNHTKNLVKILMNKQEIFQSEKIKNETENLDNYSNKQIFYNKKIANYLSVLFQWPNIIWTIAIIMLLYVLWNSYLSWNIEISAIVWVSSALILMKWALDKWITFFKDFTKEFVDIEKLWDFFDKAPTISWYSKWKLFDYKNWNISLENIDYSYVKWKNILKNFSLEINWWSITAFVWPSWWWKSTIAKLIWWYIQADSWEILVDWQKLSETSLKSYYQNIWYLTQEPSVFDWTVLENLTYASVKDIWDAEIEKAIKMAKCEFIYELPNSLETEIWERWIRLSGWQRQRLAIAKIILKNPKIIILDEPTSALDSFSEEQITIALNNLFKNRTVIVIAHRLQTVKHADKIFLIENWKVLEEWTHKTLQEKNWLYAKMLELQSGF